MEFLHRAVLVSNLKGTWRLELNIHYTLSSSVIRKSISVMFGWMNEFGESDLGVVVFFDFNLVQWQFCNFISFQW